MTKVLNLGALLVFVSGMAWADAIVLDGASMVNVPSSIGDSMGCGITANCGTMGGPYWDNISGDGTAMNIGNFLTGTGGFSGDPNMAPYQYLSQDNGLDNPDAPTNIALLQNSSNVTFTMLSANTLDFTNGFGYYDASATTAAAAAATEHPLFGSGPLTSDEGLSSTLEIPSGNDYGFYLNRCLVYTDGTNSTCLQYTTWFSNDALDTSDLGHQHFVIFDSQTAGVFYVGIEDWLANTGEGYGDYNDIMFELDAQTLPTPEPATLGLMGVGLLGIALASTRARKNRTQN
jgi:hypothetical protein